MANPSHQPAKAKVPLLQRDFATSEEQNNPAWTALCPPMSGDNGAYRVSSYTIPDTGTPQWLQNRRKNNTYVGLVGMPYELQRLVFGYLDPISLFALRQTCSAFLHLMESASEIRRLVRPRRMKLLDRVNRRNGYYIFFTPEGWRFCEEYASPLECHMDVMDELRKYDTQLCLRCRKPTSTYLYLRWSTTPRWCGGCCDFHDPMFFSERQRTRPPVEWMCVGQDGSLPLCRHKSVKWDEIASLAAEQSEGTETAEQSEGSATTPSAAADFGCQHPEHVLGSRSRTWCTVTPGDLAGSFDLNIVWLQPAFDFDPTVPIQRSHIRRFLSAQDTAPGTWGAAFCPHVKPNDGRLLLPFDPSRCVCFLDWTNAEAVAAAMAPTEHTHEDGKLCCRCATQLLLDPELGTERPKQPELMSVISAENGGFEEPTWDEDTRHAYTCPQCEACYTWVRGAGVDGGRVYLRCHRQLLCQTTPTSKRWLKHLSPASWLAEEDDADRDRKGLFVCDTPGCQRQARSGVLFPNEPQTLADDWLPMHLSELRNPRLREEAALEAAKWVENQMANMAILRQMQPNNSGCAKPPDVGVLGYVVETAAAEHPSPRMVDAIRRIEAAWALDLVTDHIMQWVPPALPTRMPELALPWAKKEEGRLRRRAKLDNQRRVFPGVLDESLGSLENRLEMANLLLEQDDLRNSGKHIGGIDFRQLVPQVTSEHVYFVQVWRTIFDSDTWWQGYDALTSRRLQHWRIAVRDAAIYAVQNPSQDSLVVFQRTLHH